MKYGIDLTLAFRVGPLKTFKSDFFFLNKSRMLAV